MIQKEIFGLQTVSHSLYKTRHNADLATAETTRCQSHPNNPRHLGYNSDHVSCRTESTFVAHSAMSLTVCGVSWCSSVRSEIGKILEQCS